MHRSWLRHVHRCIPTLLIVCVVLAKGNKSGVAQWLACWDHNPKVRGSKPRVAIFRQAGAPSLRSPSAPLPSPLPLCFCLACCWSVIPHYVPDGHELCPAMLAHNMSACILLADGKPLEVATCVFATLITTTLMSTTSLYSSVVERQSCKLKVLGSIPSGG